MQRIGIGFNGDTPIQQMTEFAVAAERMGFDSFWMHEHSFGRDALGCLNATALSTSRIRLGAACLNPYTRHPIVLAVSMMTLQETSGGRCTLGLGTGFPARLDSMGIRHDKPIGALKETIGICRRIWSGENVSVEGRTFALKNVKSVAGMPTSKIPIFVAGWKKQMLALTGALADGYIAKGGESPQSLARIVREIRESAKVNRRNISALEICAYLLTLVGENEEVALDLARKDPFVNYMLSVQDDYLYEETGISPELKKPIAENYFKGRVDESSKHVTDEMLKAFTLCGTSDQIADRIVEYRKSGLTLPILQPISMKQEDVFSVIKAGGTLISSVSG